MSKPSSNSSHISQSPTKPVKLHKIPPLIRTTTEWRFSLESDIIAINKYQPKMLSKIHISHLNSDGIQNLGTQNLRRALIATKSVSSLKLDNFEFGYQNAWQLERIISFTNHLKKLVFTYTKCSEYTFNRETIKSLTRLGKCRNLTKLDILLDIPVNTQNEVLKGLTKQIPRLKKLKILTLNATHCYTGWDQQYDLNATLLKLKPPRSLSSLSLDFTEGDFPVKQLLMFTENLQRCHLLENLALNYVRINKNIEYPEAFIWDSCFRKMQNLKTLTFNRCIFPRQELKGTQFFLESCKSIENLTALNLGITTDLRKIQPFILLYAPFSDHLKSLDLEIFNLVCSFDANFRVFLTNLQSLTQLEKLHLKFPGCPDVDDTVLQDISQALEQTKNLKDFKLRLIAKNITDEAIIPFAQALKPLVHLTILKIKLKESYLNHDSVKILANSIVNLGLTSFSLVLGQQKDSQSKLKSKKLLTPLFSAISGFKELSSLRLNLSTFNILNKEMKSFSTALKKLKKLSKLVLELPQFDSANNFEGLRNLLSSVVSLTGSSDDKEKKNLTSLKLTFAGEEFCHEELSYMISDLEKCDSLEFLHLKFRHTWYVGSKYLDLFIPKFGSLSSLRNLVIQFKDLDVSDSETFFKIIRGWRSSLKNLKDILIRNRYDEYL